VTLTFKSFHRSPFASCCYGKYIKQENTFEKKGCTSLFRHTGADIFVPEKFYQGKAEINTEIYKNGGSMGRN